MTAKPEDRRIRRTKRLLKQGLAELMQKKEFKDISVRDITDRMDLNRGTFYLHYTDTYDLLQRLESDVLKDVQVMIDEHCLETDTNSMKPVFEPILDYVVENHDICYALFVNNATSNFMEKVQNLIYENGVNILHRRFSHVPDDKLEYLLSFITYGLLGLLKQWFDCDMALPKGDIVVMADKFVTASAEQLIG
ncbi:MAG: TetR/AcrR family transcriptional regulator C-terminal domain-containing protein [Intestinimonas sp.]|jgi:AcrR family transcriptional regulator|nr:TetR/AcrR family transcriptional regulator C-terminal domain-containing protein [Intestinimonas sp.]